MAWELINNNPFKDIEKERSEMDRLLDTFLFGKPRASGSSKEEEWQPPIDIAETEGELVVSVEIPGVESEDIDLSLKGDTLFIEGEIKPENKEKEESYYFSERRNRGSFSRSIRLPVGVQSNQISASYRNGVLRIVLPRKKKIKVKIE